MTHIVTTEVFGIRKNIKSYIEREHVDDLFKLALKSDRQILVYGASKQGKTALVSNYCGYDEHIVYELTPETELIDIYQFMLRESGITIRTEYTEGQGSLSSLKFRAKISASFALFGKGSLASDGGISGNSNKNERFEEIPFNIAQPQEVASLLKRANSKKLIILENFHYLTYENQDRFSYDLRAFQDLGVRFIILGVWKEKNRMAQFNGDLLDRIKEIPVEPWLESDFRRIVEVGQKKLKIKLPNSTIKKCCEASFSSVGVFQDLLLEVCIASGIHHCKDYYTVIAENDCLPQILKDKADAYGARHKRSFEGIAASSKNNNKHKLYYHIVDILLEEGFEGIKNGMHIQHIHEKIRCRSKSVKVKYRTVVSALKDINKIQVQKNINPAILSFDENSSLLAVIDSTMYFFLKNADLKSFRQELKNSFETRI